MRVVKFANSTDWFTADDLKNISEIIDDNDFIHGMEAYVPVKIEYEGTYQHTLLVEKDDIDDLIISIVEED